MKKKKPLQKKLSYTNDLEEKKNLVLFLLTEQQVEISAL